MSETSPQSREQALEFLRSAVADPKAYALAWKERTGRPVVGTFCSYVPEEPILAGGALPHRVLDVPGEFARADTRLQAYACCLARGALELGMSGQAGFLDGVVFSNTCDTMQCLSDIWLANVDGAFVETFMVPVFVDHSASREYLIAETKRFVASAGKALGTPIEDEALREAVRTAREVRSVQGRLRDAQLADTPLLSPTQYYDATMARWIVEPHEYIRAINIVLDDPPVRGGAGPRIAIAGGPLYAPALARQLEELGANWVADDLCTAGRSAHVGADPPDDPYAAIADRLVARPVCPAKHRSDEDPGRRVVELALEARAQGVVLYRLKFCEPHAFDYPQIKRRLDETSIPNHLIEVETPSSSVGQLRTRLEAFLEMLGEQRTAEAPS